MGNNGKKWMVFAVGVLTGLILGTITTLLTTPYTGSEMRGKIVKGTRDSLRKLREARENLEKEIEVRAKDFKGDAAKKISEIKEKINETFSKIEEKLSGQS